jgi:hypothetical protein
MAKYGAELTKATTSTTVGVGSLEAPASGMRRIALQHMLFGSEAAPAENAFKLRVRRTTTANTGSAVVPRALDAADPVAVSLPKENLTVEGSLSDITGPAVPTHQKATFQWWAMPGSEIIVPATALAGLIFQTPTAGGTPAATWYLIFEER